MFCINSHLKKEGAISTYQVTEFDVIRENYIKDVTFVFTSIKTKLKCSAVVHCLN
jgi:hypothetical protein